MTERRSRAALVVFGALLLVGGLSVVAMGVKVFGAARSHRDLFTPTVVRWWRDGAWGSYAAVLALGLFAATAGVLLARAAWRPSGGRRLTPTITLSDGRTTGHGTTGAVTVRSAALVRSVRHDLEQLSGVERAGVQLCGVYPNLEIRAVLDVDGASDLQTLVTRVKERLARLDHTAGIKPQATRVNIRLR
jgi:hypothetical protein